MVHTILSNSEAFDSDFQHIQIFNDTLVLKGRHEWSIMPTTNIHIYTIYTHNTHIIYKQRYSKGFSVKSFY